MNQNEFIFGKSPLERIVGAEVGESTLTLFQLQPDGSIREIKEDFQPWALFPSPVAGSFKLEGDLHYKYLKFGRRYGRDQDSYVTWNGVESAAQLYGFTYYKGLKISEIPILSFDIESHTMEHGPDARVLLITNTFRHKDRFERRVFNCLEYETDAAMFEAWSAWVCQMDPAIITGHHVIGFDFPYMNYCARKAGIELRIGRGGKPLYIEDYTRRYRRDGSQSYEYNDVKVWGREVVDTMFLAYKYDVARAYPNYKLKGIIAFERLEREGRQHYDASKIRTNFWIPEERAKIIEYAKDDADDPLKLFDLMAPSLFYLTQSVPKSFQQIINSASGSWLNSFLIRSYLQKGHSIPKASEKVDFEGAISFGVPGIYRNCLKLDVNSLYPSVMLQYQIHSEEKDPAGHFLKMVDYFTTERLRNKKLAAETGDRHYKDLSESGKIFVNSAYGLLGAPGLNFNYPEGAGQVTKYGRTILESSIWWAKCRDFNVIGGDTDSILFCKSDQSEFTPMEQQVLVVDINREFPEKIKFAHDGYYPRVLYAAAKNYCLDDGKKLKFKGSALKATMKEIGCREFIDRGIRTLLASEDLLALYNEYVSEIVNLTDITRWSSKKTITPSVLNPARTNEQKVLDALEGLEYQAGDRVFLYFDREDKLKRQELWTGDHNQARLLEKLYKTVQVFSTLLDTKSFPNYSLKRNQAKLQAFKNSPAA